MHKAFFCTSSKYLTKSAATAADMSSALQTLESDNNN